MATPDPVPAGASAPTTARPGEQDNGRYTGVVIIHGVGDIKRNTTLEEAVNALAYWFNHVAGLVLRREGQGRMWVSARLTDDPNPDAVAARARLDLAATGTWAALVGAAELRLEFREVWWAESFGVPSIGATIAWARVQAWEQAKHLLLPIGRRLGPHHVSAGTSRSGAFQRRLFMGVLGLYGLIQYIWKAAQWLILTPLILLLLWVVGLIRLIAFLPPLRTGVVAGLSALLDAIMLHWIAEAQVYTQDYVRSAGIRERFEREVGDLLRDDRCDRVVVIAHSMGAVIAYEGLTSVLDRDEFRDGRKPMTFICLGAALRRAWLMTPDDPLRLRDVLPDRVRWLNFWARYDPVSAGPLSARSLPRLDPWPLPAVTDPQEKLRDRLDLCENVGVTNTDSAFTDHQTYWQNLEQVVGPVAWELVDGNPALELVVLAHLATPNGVLLRRWRVAWRSVVALASGFGLGAALLVWDGSQHWMRLGHTLATAGLLNLVGDVLGAVVSGSAAVISDLQKIIAGLVPNGSPLSFDLMIPAPIAYMLWSVAAAVVVAAVGILGIGRALALPSPIAFDRATPGPGVATWAITALMAGYLVVPFVGRAILYGVPGASVAATKSVLYALEATADLCGAAALVLAVASSARRRLGGWEAALLLLPAPFAILVAYFILVSFAILPSYIGGPDAAKQAYQGYVPTAYGPAFAGAVVGIVGCFYFLRSAGRRAGVGQIVLVLVLGVVLAWSAVAFVASDLLGVGRDVNVFLRVGDNIVFVGLFMPVLVYALTNGAADWWRRREAWVRNRGIVNLSVAALVLLNASSLLRAMLPHAVAARQVVGFAGVGAVGLLGLLALGGALLRAAGDRQWGWLAGMLLTVVVVSLVASLIPPGSDGYLDTLGWLAGLVGAGPSAAALVYGLWGGQRPEEKSRPLSPGPGGPAPA